MARRSLGATGNGSQHAGLGGVGRAGSARQVGPDPDRRRERDGQRPHLRRRASASPTPPRGLASSAHRGSTGARTTTPASRSTTLPDGRRLFVGWLNNWQYAQSNTVPTTAVVARSAERAARAHAADGRTAARNCSRCRCASSARCVRARRTKRRDQTVTGERDGRRPPARCSTSRLSVPSADGVEVRPEGPHRSQRRRDGDRLRRRGASALHRPDEVRAPPAAAITGFYGVHSAPLTLRDGSSISGFSSTTRSSRCSPRTASAC